MLDIFTRSAAHVGEITMGVSLIILILLLLDRRLDARYSARWRCWVWLVLAVRLIIPWNFSLPQAPVQLHIPATPQAQAEMPTNTTNMYTPTYEKESTSPSIPPSDAQDVPQMQPTTPASIPALTWAQMLTLVWLAGILLFLTWHGVAAWHFWHSLHPWCRAVDANTRSLYEQLCQELHLSHPPRLMQCRKLYTPMAIGLLRPTVLLPRERLTQQQLEMVLRHELTHIRRHDLWYQLLILTARGMHWFNPLVHLMGHMAQRDMELACDAQVVAGQDNAYRRGYGDAILSTAAHVNSPTLSTGFAGGKRMLQHRLSNLFDRRQRKRGITALALLTTLAVAIGTLVACGPSQENKGERYVNEDLGFALTFPKAWQSEEPGMSKYMVVEEDGQVTVNQLYPYKLTDSTLPMGPILFTIQRLDGGLLIPDDVAMGPPTQILEQTESYTYVAVFPGDVQSPPPEETEAYETYQLLSGQVDEVLDTLEVLTPVQSENGYKLVGSGLFTMHIPDNWQLVDTQFPFYWQLMQDNTPLATTIQDVWNPSWQGKGMEQTEDGMRIWNGDLQRAFLLNWEADVPAEQRSQVENSIQLRGMQYNIYDLQSLSLQYLAYNQDAQKLFGRIANIDTHEENGSTHYDGMTIALYEWADSTDEPYAKDLNQTMYLPSAVEASPTIAPLDEQSQLMPYFFQWISPADLAQNGDYQNNFYDFTIIHGNLYLAIGHYVP